MGLSQPTHPRSGRVRQARRETRLRRGYVRHADSTCSATTIRYRRDEWITAGVLDQLEHIVLTAYDQTVGLDLADVTVDGQITKTPCRGEAAGNSPVDRGSSESSGLDSSTVTASRWAAWSLPRTATTPHCRPTLEKLGRFELALPEQMAVHLDARTDSKVTRELLDELGCEWRIRPKGDVIAISHTRRWVYGTDQLLVQPRVQLHRHLHRTTHHSHQRTTDPDDRYHRHPPPHPRSLDHPPLGCPATPATMTIRPLPARSLGDWVVEARAQFSSGDKTGCDGCSTPPHPGHREAVPRHHTWMRRASLGTRLWSGARRPSRTASAQPGSLWPHLTASSLGGVVLPLPVSPRRASTTQGGVRGSGAVCWDTAGRGPGR